MNITRVRGTQDLINAQIWNTLTTLMAKVLQAHGFSPASTPILEKTELFARAVGADTDIVSKEMYTFESGSEGSMCLRPEMTASMVRAYFENKVADAPWKNYQIGPLFRHERPQKGRLRQFHQANIEVINAPSVGHDIHFLLMLQRMVRALDLKDAVLHLNFLGVSEDRARHRTALLAFVTQHLATVCETCRVRTTSNLLRIFDCKNPTCQQLYTQAPKLTEFLGEQSAAQWRDIQERLALVGVNFILNPLLVRGLDYYNGLVFEMTSDALGSQNAFCGGGRYDLAQALGANQALPSFGAGIGIERVYMILEAQGHPLFASATPLIECAIVPFDATFERNAEQLSQFLYHNNIAHEIVYDGASIKHRMKKADKLGAPWVLVIGQTEAEQETVNAKNMKTGESFSVKMIDVPAFLVKNQKSL